MISHTGRVELARETFALIAAKGYSGFMSYEAPNEAAWKRMVEFVHAHSRAKIGLQLAHAGRKGSCNLPWEGDDPLRDVEEPRAPEGNLAGNELVQDDAERVDIRADVDVLEPSVGLLRRHVERRPDRCARDRAHPRRRRRDALRQSEVEQLRLSVRRHQDVPGLQVAMNDALHVRVVHRAARLHRGRQHLVERTSLRPPVQRSAVADRLH